MSAFLKDLNILIIEDNLGDFTLIEDYLNEQSEVVVINLATSYNKAKESLSSKNHFDIILLDLSLPDADGIELVNNVVELAGNTPVIVLTGNSDKDFGINTIALGISDYLLKDELTAASLNKSIFYSIERCRINTALKESEAKYRNLFSQNPLPVWVYDTETLCFLDVNDAAILHYGYSKDEFLSMKITEIRPVEDISLLHARIEATTTFHPFLKSGVRHLKKDGTIIYVEIQGTPTSFGNKDARLIIAIDITEKIIAETALKQSEKLFKSLVQEGTDLITILDVNGVYTYLSPNQETITGYKSGELIGRSAFELIHESDREICKVQFDQLTSQRTVFIPPIRFKHKNNKWIWIESTVTNLSDDPSICGIVSNSRDVTERVEKEKILQDSNERFNYAARATSDVIWEWNSEKPSFFREYGYSELFGYHLDHVDDLSNFWSSKVHPEDFEDTWKIMTDARNNPEVNKWICNYRFLKADGQYAYVKEKAIIVRNEQGIPIRTVGSMQDITNLKLEEQRLKLFESIITKTSDIVLIAEHPIDNADAIIIHANEAFTLITGYAKEEIIGKSQRLMYGDKTDYREIKCLYNMLERGESGEIEVIYYKKNGEEFWVNINMVPVLNAEGMFTHWIAIERDITLRKKQEIEREQFIGDLTHSIKDLKQFAYITSHNLRAPLANLLGLLTLLDEVEIHDEMLNEILTGFKTSTEYLNHTINDLVKVLIIKDNPSSIEKIQINSLFKNVTSQLGVLVEDIKPTIKVDVAASPVVTFNKIYLESILFNLLTNALKFRSPQRPLEISLESARVDNCTVLTFADNGIGLDTDRYGDRVFGFYQRFHNHPDSKGLGLYMIKLQMEALGGTVSMQSQVDVGTKFCLTFKS